jgi:endoglucanase
MKGDFRMHKTRRTILLAGLAALALGLLPVLAGAGACNSKTSTFYVPKADTGATQQIVSLIRHHKFSDAALLQKMVGKGHAVWLTGGTPSEVRHQVKTTVEKARAKHQVPVFVAYDVPFRDCGQYSAGGAPDTARYEAWIDGVAAGMGSSKALLLLEPDGLGIIPYNTDINGGAEWCQPDLTGTGLTPATANAARYTQLNYAVDKLEAQPNVKVYLDGTHNGWLGVGDAADRLVKAGVNRAAGFFLNVSNYQYTSNLVSYGTWVSQCIASGSYAGCPNQYWNGGPPTWVGTALSTYGVWSDTASDPALSTAGINARYATYPAGTTHFVIDTGRNGLGPWDYRGSYASAGVAQDWCNPPGRGAGIAPTTNTGNALVDAYLWVKVPGESDGQCTRGTAGPADPEWGLTDPIAGAWFPQQALQLAQLANPALN